MSWCLQPVLRNTLFFDLIQLTMFINTFKFLLGVVLIGSFTTTLKAQEVHGKPNVWYLLLANHKLNDQVNLGTELHMRFDDWMADEQQFLFRPYIDFNTKKTPNVVYSFGYTYIKTFPYGDYPLNIAKPENNIWEQVTFKHQYNQLKVQHRYRLEQRWQKDIVYDAVNDDYELDGATYANRFRYRLTLTQPITESVFVNIFDELWFNGDKSLRNITFDRNWLYIGLGYSFTEDVSLQLAYLHQYAMNSPIRYERHHGLQVTGAVTF